MLRCTCSHDTLVQIQVPQGMTCGRMHALHDGSTGSNRSDEGEVASVCLGDAMNSQLTQRVH